MNEGRVGLVIQSNASKHRTAFSWKNRRGDSPFPQLYSSLQQGSAGHPRRLLVPAQLLHPQKLNIDVGSCIKALMYEQDHTGHTHKDTHTHIHTNTHTQTHTHTHTQTHTHTDIQTCTRLHTYTDTHKHTHFMHAHTSRTHIHTDDCAMAQHRNILSIDLHACMNACFVCCPCVQSCIHVCFKVRLRLYSTIQI